MCRARWALRRSARTAAIFRVGRQQMGVVPTRLRPLPLLLPACQRVYSPDLLERAPVARWRRPPAPRTSSRTAGVAASRPAKPASTACRPFSTAARIFCFYHEQRRHERAAGRRSDAACVRYRVPGGGGARRCRRDVLPPAVMSASFLPVDDPHVPSSASDRRDVAGVHSSPFYLSLSTPPNGLLMTSLELRAIASCPFARLGSLSLVFLLLVRADRRRKK